MKEVIIRTISGSIYILIVIFSMYTSRTFFLGLFSILGLITLREFLKLVDLKSYIPYILLLIALYFLSYSEIQKNVIFLYLTLTLAIGLLLAKDIFSVKKTTFLHRNKYLPTIFYLISGFVFLTLIPYSEGVFLPEIIVSIFVLIWSNDTFAYVVGKSFGKHKLLERISPKKTIEGFLGGLIGAIIAGFVIFKITAIYNLQIWLTLAIIASVIGTIGDLIQSKFKRQAGVKDSGNIMPGHGGLFDRLDSIIYTSPFIYAFLEIVSYVS